VYFAALAAHSLVRWVILALGILALAAAFSGGPRRRALPFVIALDLQVIVGALLWLFLSPLTSSLRDALHDPAARRFAAEHPAMGLLAALLAHGGNVAWKKDRPRLGAILLLLALLLALGAVPWSRPLLPF
jgi:hypothetical protein